MRRLASRLLVGLALLAGAGVAPAGGARADAPLRVVATVPDLADLAARVGGEAVEARALVQGPQDPHFIEARPSFVRALHDADVLVVVGLDLESGWMPALLQAARNPRIQPGGDGHLDASTAVRPLQVPMAVVDRSMGDVHPFGNPHYLPDPVNGLRVAAAIRDRLSALRPAQAAGFAARYDAFARELAERLVGPELAARASPEEIVAAVEGDRLDALVRSRGAPLGGWLATVRTPTRLAVEDHRAWIYLARRFGLELVDALEPLPGIAPTTRHLAEVIETVRARNVSLILSTPYFSPRHAEFVARETGARIVPLAHQVGSRPGADDYLSTVDTNVRLLAGAP